MKDNPRIKIAAPPLKSGYKNTEIGMLPKAWGYGFLGENSTKIGSGITPTGGSSVYKDFGRPFVRSQNIGWGKLILDDIAFIDDDTHMTFPNTEIKLYDVLLNISGASIGRSSFATSLIVGGNVNQHVCIIRAVEENLHPIYLNLFLLSRNGQKQIDSFQSGGNRQGLNINQIKAFKIPLPPLPEQKAIATVLSDTDNLIQALEKKIAKKQLIKKGAMQELLRPKEGWEVKSLFELADKKKSLFDDGDWIEAEHITSNGIRLIQTGNIGVGGFVEKETKKYIFESSFKNLKCKTLQVGDLLICRLAEPAGRACIFPKISNDKVITSVDVTIYRPLKNLANRIFLQNIFSTQEWFEKVNENVGGTTHKRISRGALGRIKISIPSIGEQNKTALILSSMDSEIEALNKKLAKYKQLKQGLMQQLLTGKIRLV